MTKEDKIIKILEKYDIDEYHWKLELAKELHEHYMKFMEWLTFGDHQFYPQKENGENVFYDYERDCIATCDEVYQLWLALPENVKNI